MGIFSKIRDKIFGHDDQTASNGAPAPATNVQTASPTPPATTPAASPAAATASPEAASLPQVDVGAVLSAMADARGGGGNYQSSIVDIGRLYYKVRS